MILKCGTQDFLEVISRGISGGITVSNKSKEGTNEILFYSSKKEKFLSFSVYSNSINMGKNSDV